MRSGSSPDETLFELTLAFAVSSEIVNALAAVADSSSLDSSKHQAVKKLLKLLHASLSRVLQSVGAAKEQNEDELVVQAVATVALWLLSRDMVLAQEEGDVVAAVGPKQTLKVIVHLTNSLVQLVGLLTFIVEALATGPISAATPLLPSFMSHLLLTINNSQQALLNSLLPSIFRLIINWLNTLLLALSTSAPYSTRTDADRRNRVAYLIITLEELLSVIKERKEWCEEVAQGLTRIFGGEGRLELVGEVTEERVLRVLIGLWEGYEMIEESEGIVGAA